MIENLVMMGVFMFMCSLISLSVQSSHLMNCLLSLEMMLLGLVFLVFFLMSVKMMDFLMPLVVLVFGASEASLGLALLVMMIRASGQDYTLSSLFKC
uniref:NADH-ubiquinone oxidoreductase chain 4L n=1 Tax=Scutopus ventrolineatus TaxID=52922 RepID=A0A096XEB4_SCUVE|nr:NADH dehydrogenase subunit 4L [Scutopus ventrolineatus]AHI45699.1 NADH dehydrogenase subunit 4L [Scutopus ventrolineatus]